MWLGVVEFGLASSEGIADEKKIEVDLIEELR